MIRSYKWLTGVLLLLSACYLFKETAVLPEKLLPASTSWIDESLQKMSLDQKIGQLIVFSTEQPLHGDPDPSYLKLQDYVRRYHIAGLLINNGEAYQTLACINHLQSLAATPLLIAGSFRNGVGGSIKGATAFVSPAGLAAAGQYDSAYKTGIITAREARVLGFHLTLSPCAALASNASGFISYSQEARETAKYCVSAVNGLRENGLLACATHFPGISSGGTADKIGKSMISLTDWQENGLQPFSESIRAGVAFIMPSNSSFPVMDQGFERPVSFSPYLLNEILRSRLKFEGVIISDVLTDKVIKKMYYPGMAAVKAIDAGVDLLILEGDIQTVFAAIRKAVQDKKISMQRIDLSVKRILYWKSVLGLQDKFSSDMELARSRLHTSAAQKIAENTASEAVTLLNNRDLPVIFRKDLQLYTITYTTCSANDSSQAPFLDYLRLTYPRLHTATLSPDFSQERRDSVLQEASASDVIVNLYYLENERPLSDGQEILISRLDSLKKTVIHVMFGYPHLGRYFPYPKNLLLAYSNISVCQRAAAFVLSGRLAATGKLPLTLPGLAVMGSGDLLSPQTMALQPFSDRSLLAMPAYLDSLHNFLQTSIADSAFPGCAITAGYRNQLIMNEAFGRFTYAARSDLDQPNSIFDLASLTKVVATTSIAMILYDRGQLKLDWPVQDIIPEFQGENKDLVTIRHLLTHTSGLPGWHRFYLTLQGKERIMQAICRTDLIYQPGTQTVYSDLGMILMQKILETIAQKPLNLLLEEYVTLPLGMTRTFYNPDPQYFNEIVPTEISEFHKKLVRGFVHDENAFAMGGVSGHAGLFSTTEDLAVFCQMYLNGGIYKYNRIFQPQTIQRFTAPQNLVEESTRALGWDTRSEEQSMSGDFMSMQAFGHSGFTGTTIWIDPQNDLFVVFLTNRVYPTRENHKIQQVRPRIHNYVMQAIKGIK